MTPEHSRTYRAAWVLPISRPPIHNGVVTVRRGRIESCGPFSGEADVVDLGDVALMPGLVNAHTHLEFSDLEAPIGRPGMSIANWLPEVVRRRRAQQLTEQDRINAITGGIDESIACGTRLLGEIATKSWPIDVLSQTLLSREKLFVTAFWEVLGLATSRSDELLQWCDAQLLCPTTDHFQHAISPHAPYTVPPALADACIDRSANSQIPLAMHLAESREERELVESGTGPLHDVFSKLGIDGLDQFPWSSPTHEGAIENLLQRICKSTRALIIHGNYLSKQEIAVIAEHSAKASVIYCPRTHAYFGHDPHPVRELLDAGICVGLGTDSRASNPDLNLWSEAKHVMQTRSDISPSEVLRMATLSGAQALGRSKFGRLEAGCDGGLFAVETSAKTESQLWQQLPESTRWDMLKAHDD